MWAEDTDFQRDCINGIISNIRNKNHQLIHDNQARYLISQKAFYVPNGDYVINYFGDKVRSYESGLFYGGNTCTLSARLAIPLYAMDTVIGLVGYSDKPDDWPDDQAFVKYLFPPKRTYTKGRYMYISKDEFIKAREEGYVCIVDGLFDKITLQSLGINAVSLCGSSLTEWHQMYLSFIKHKIVIADNDIAGRHLASYCKYKLSDCVEICQDKTGDIDDFIVDDKTTSKIIKCLSEMKSEGYLFSKEIRK